MANLVTSAVKAWLRRILAPQAGSVNFPDLMESIGAAVSAVETESADNVTRLDALDAKLDGSAADKLGIIQYCKGTYSFATHTGAQGTYTIGGTVPEGAMIVSCYTNVTTPMTSGGAATVQLKCGATEVMPATAFDNGQLTGLDENTGDPVLAPATGAMKFVIGGADLTAGVVEVYFGYIAI